MGVVSLAAERSKKRVGHVDLLLSNRRTVAGRVVEQDPHAVALSFPIWTAPSLREGDRVRLDFPKRGVRDARVRARRDEDDLLLYVFRLEGRTERVAHVGGNRRSSFRVKPAPMDGIEAFLEVSGRDSAERAISVVDLSVTGLALQLSQAADLFYETVVVTFNLPTRHRPLRIVGRVRSRRDAPNGPIYGIEFDSNRSPGFQIQQQAISRYVMERQREWSWR
jgi:hypothetical protein